MARRTDETLQLDEGRCFGCAACVALCPIDVLDLDGLLININEPECTHCELCIPACPVNALFFSSPNQNELVA